MKSTVLFSLFLIVPCLAAVMDSPPAPRGTIDFRYPDYIVDPRPECLSEGVFPHPRNCSWFFRCHDAHNVGFYRQFYFECEPGTVFSDDLDQCLFPSMVAPPCGTKGENPTPTTKPITTPTTKPITTPPPKKVCYDSMYKCKVYLCPNTQGDMVSVGRQCETAVSQCDDGVRTYYCAPQQFFDIVTRTCVTNPSERNCVDEDDYSEVITTTTEKPTTTPTTTTTTVATTTKPADCYDSMIECKIYQCPPDNSESFLCKKGFRTCNRNVLTFFCDDTHFYNYNTKQCVDLPSKSGCKEKGKIETKPPPVVVTPPMNETFHFQFNVVCSVEDETPRNSNMTEFFCKKIESCKNEVTVEVELCLKYLECKRSGDDWTVEIKACPNDQYFNYDDGICQETPTVGSCQANRNIYSFLRRKLI